MGLLVQSFGAAAAVLLASVSVDRAVADIFIGPSSATNRLVLSSTQIALITGATLPEPTLEDPNEPILWVTPQSTNQLVFGLESNVNPSALMGPGEIILQ